MRSTLAIQASGQQRKTHTVLEINHVYAIRRHGAAGEVAITPIKSAMKPYSVKGTLKRLRI